MGPGEDQRGSTQRLSRRLPPVLERADSGQATVELALVLPVVILFALIVVQAVAVGRDYVLVQHAAREAARAGAVDPDGSTVRLAAVGAADLEPGRLSTRWRGGTRGDAGIATVRYRSPTVVPVVGRLVGDIELSASVSIRIE